MNDSFFFHCTNFSLVCCLWDMSENGEFRVNAQLLVFYKIAFRASVQLDVIQSLLRLTILYNTTLDHKKEWKVGIYKSKVGSVSAAATRYRGYIKMDTRDPAHTKLTV